MRYESRIAPPADRPRGSGAHVDRDADRLEYLSAIRAVAQRGLGMEPDAAVAAPGDADRERDQLLGLGIERARPGGGLGETGEGRATSGA